MDRKKSAAFLKGFVVVFLVIVLTLAYFLIRRIGSETAPSEPSQTEAPSTDAFGSVVQTTQPPVLSGSCDLLFGCGEGDDEDVLGKMVQKILRLRIFEDGNSKMNLSVRDIGGSVLMISQFTLLADCRSGNRPSFSHAMKADEAKALYVKAIEVVRSEGVECGTGAFGEHMVIEQENDGPVTIILDSERIFPRSLD